MLLVELSHQVFPSHGGDVAQVVEWVVHKSQGWRFDPVPFHMPKCPWPRTLIE